MPLAFRVIKLARKSATCSLRAFLVSPRSYILAYFSEHAHPFLAPPLRVPPRAARECSTLFVRLRVPRHGLPSLRTGPSDARWTVSQLPLRTTYRGARKQSAICSKEFLVKIALLRAERERVGVCGHRRRLRLPSVRRGCGLDASMSGAGCGRLLSNMGMCCIQPTWRRLPRFSRCVGPFFGSHTLSEADGCTGKRA